MNATYKHFFPNLHWCNIMRNNLKRWVLLRLRKAKAVLNLHHLAFTLERVKAQSCDPLKVSFIFVIKHKYCVSNLMRNLLKFGN